MLGLRAETDDSSKLTAQRVQPRSYRFAGRLAGRFNVAGVSGGLEKHTRELQELEMRKARVEARRTYVAPLLQKKQKQDLINDAKRLVELEESLREVCLTVTIQHY